MGEDVTMAYGTDGLRTGSAGLRGVAGLTDTSSRALQAAPLEPVMFGLTPGAPAFAAAVAAAREAQARGFQQQGQRSAALAGRTDVTAELGDGLTTDTAGVARSATPGVPRLNGPGRPGAGAGRPAMRRMIPTGIAKKPLRSGVE